MESIGDLYKDRLTDQSAEFLNYKKFLKTFSKIDVNQNLSIKDEQFDFLKDHNYSAMDGYQMKKVKSMVIRIIR